MKKSCLWLTASTVFGLLVSYHAMAESIGDALRESEARLHLRLRYESVEQESLEDASALTLKSRLTLTTGVFKGLTALMEMDDVTALTDVDYNDGTVIYPGTAAVPDPEGTEVNQAYLAYDNFGTTFKYGRQRILLDNQRFVGGVGWRQNEQTYDGFSISNESVEDFLLFYAYVHNVNRIFGEAVAAGDHQQQTHLFNGRYEGWQAGSLIAYAYLIDNKSAVALSSDTYGLRWEGQLTESLAYNLEYAYQREAGDNPVDYASNYGLAEAIVSLPMAQLTLGYEVLGSDHGEAAFSTPLATLHKFQGWTDKFLATPARGIEDVYIGVAKQIAGVNVSLVYHQLSAEEGDMDYGSEVGFVASKSLGPVDLTVKLADYAADDFATDTRKVWLMASAAF